MPEARLLRVMVVDDQASMRALVRNSLADLGCRNVIECADGQDAVNELQHGSPNLIISDMTMPRLDGLSLLKIVRANPRLNKVGFIMLTSRADVELVKQAVALGVNNYLVKPFSLGGLRQKVEAVVGALT
ncbi:MAG TPA: response regulator [Caulobacteraceae bacterium]|jgi:two-component system chemotaxis response regulator CheY|nr:response regulator [Caulobacteraceae bacterium]